MAAPLLFPYRRAWPLVLALALAAPSRAGDTWGLVGASLGPLRNSPRRVLADMELDHQVDDGPFGVWAALDVSTNGDYYVGTGPGVSGPPTPAGCSLRRRDPATISARAASTWAMRWSSAPRSMPPAAWGTGTWWEPPSATTPTAA